jgi:hypothetical protein
VVLDCIFFCKHSSCFYHFPFPVSTVQRKGEFWNNKGNTTSSAAQIILAQYIVSQLKVVSSENLGGSKTSPTIGYWPKTMVLGIILFF